MLLIASIAWCSGLSLARAQGSLPSASHAPAPRTPRPLSYDVRIEPALTFVGGALWIGSEALKSKLAPQACRWCDDNAFDRAARSALRLPNVVPARRASDALGWGVAPALVLGSLVGVAAADGGLRASWTDLAIVAEAAVLTGGLTQLSKLTTGRERPFVHALEPDQKNDVAHPADNNLSFYSAHSGLMFSIAVSSAMVASLRGYRWAPLLWGVGPVLAGLTGYLRIAADKHYLSDVLMGAAMGSAAGVLVPWLHARGLRSNVSVSLSPSLLVLSVRR